MTRLTKDFTLEELERSSTAKRHGIDNRMPPELHGKAECYARVILQPTRDAWGIIDTYSGYRCDELNRLVGGSATSQHPKMEAGDIGGRNRSNRNLSVWMAKNLPVFDQIIYERKKRGALLVDWVHASLRMKFNGEIWVPCHTNRRQHLIKPENGRYRTFDYLKDT